MQVREALAHTIAALRMAHVDSPQLDARLLVEAATGLKTDALIAHPERPVSAAEDEVLQGLIARRSQHEPISHLLGKKEFWSLDFLVTRDTLDPRPDSETLVETVLKRIPNRAAPLRILDLGTGTGCLLLALASELPNATGEGIDISNAALEVAKENARRLEMDSRVTFTNSHWGREVTGGFDVVVSNPPYIPEKQIDTLAPEVALHEPRLALSGGVDGLDAYRAIAGELNEYLAPGGFAVLEIGEGQSHEVRSIIRAAGLKPVDIAYDLAGHTRCVVVERLE